METICWDCTVQSCATFLSVGCIPLSLLPAHSQPNSHHILLVSEPVYLMTAGITALHNIFLHIYPACPLHGNVSCHYTFENWPVLDKSSFSAFILFHASFDCMGPLEPFYKQHTLWGIFFPFMAKILGMKAFSPWPTNDTHLRSTWQWLLCHLFWWLVIRLCIYLMPGTVILASFFPKEQSHQSLFYFFFPEEIICKCLLGVFWQMCWSVVLHHWCFAVEF